MVEYMYIQIEHRDWKSLQRNYASEKKPILHEAGMYGMGSRSFFHMTIIFPIVSGSKFTAFDPQALGRVRRKARMQMFTHRHVISKHCHAVH